MKFHRVGMIVVGVAGTAMAQDEGRRSEFCDTAEHRQFDAWVGRWTVSDTDSNETVGQSQVEPVAGGCGIQEHWYPTGSIGFARIATWRPAEKKWRQIVVDGVNNWEVYEGGLTKDALVLTGASTRAGGATLTARITYRRAADGSLQQIHESSADKGKEWTLLSHLTYRPYSAVDPGNYAVGP